MDRNSSWNVLLLIGLLCVGTLGQMVGLPVTFWDLDGSSDLVESSLLEGFAIISVKPTLFPIFRSMYSCETVSVAYRLSAQHLIFHPPPPIVPAQIIA